MANPRHARLLDGVRPSPKLTRLWLFCSGLAGGRLGCRGGGRRQCRVYPARMDAAAQAFLRVGVDRPLSDETAEGRLDLPARAAETVVKVEMAEGGVHVVAPQQTDNAAA